LDHDGETLFEAHEGLRNDTGYRGTSLTRKRTPLGPYRRPIPRRVLGGVLGEWVNSRLVSNKEEKRSLGFDHDSAARHETVESGLHHPFAFRVLRLGLH